MREIVKLTIKNVDRIQLHGKLRKTPKNIQK